MIPAASVAPLPVMIEYIPESGEATKPYWSAPNRLITKIKISPMGGRLISNADEREAREMGIGYQGAGDRATSVSTCHANRGCYCTCYVNSVTTRAEVSFRNLELCVLKRILEVF